MIWDQAADKREVVAVTAVSDGEAARSSSWKRYVPQPLKKSIRSIMRRLAGHPPVEGYAAFRHGFNPRSYRRIDDDSLLRGDFR